LVSAAPRLIVVDDLDRAGPAAAEVLPVLAARVDYRTTTGHIEQLSVGNASAINAPR
jgi:hypothetical protein